jgi:hypothetical protein
MPQFAGFREELRNDEEEDDEGPDPGSFADPEGSRGPSPEPEDILHGNDIPNEHPGPQCPRNPDNPYDLSDTKLDHLKIGLDFVRCLHETDIDNCALPKDLLEWIVNPVKETFKIDDCYERLSLELYLACSNAPREVYTCIRAVMMHFNPELKLCTYNTISRCIHSWTGIDLERFDMCSNGCYAFTGPLANLDKCPECKEDRFSIGPHGKRVAKKQAFKIPITPQIQMRWRTAASSRNMQHGWRELKKNFELTVANNGVFPGSSHDVFTGTALLEQYEQGLVQRYDTMLMFSMDGAQVYSNKDSDTLIGTWNFMNYPPDLRYKKKNCAPAFIVPGPQKVRNAETFAYPSLAEVRILMGSGLAIWDGESKTTINTKVSLFMGTADGIVMTQMLGSTGHLSFHGCRFNCPMPGRLMPTGPTYYPMMQKPEHYNRDGGAHPDINVKAVAAWKLSQDTYLAKLRHLLTSPNKTQFKKQRLETGLTKPSIFLGLPEE